MCGVIPLEIFFFPILQLKVSFFSSQELSLLFAVSCSLLKTKPKEKKNQNKNSNNKEDKEKKSASVIVAVVCAVRAPLR